MTQPQISKEDMDSLLASAAEVLGTRERPVLLPGESMIGIEGAARSVAAPGRKFLNIVNGPYGLLFGRWLRQGGSDVQDLQVPYSSVISPAAVERKAEEFHPDCLCYVHTEAVTGGQNPVQQLQEIARRYDLLTIVDAVSSAGADEIHMDDWNIDIATFGLQKALNGPNGVGFTAMSARAREWIRQNQHAPHESALSLLDLYEEEASTVPYSIPSLEASAALDAFEKMQQEGLSHILLRHKAAAAATHKALSVLGIPLFQQTQTNCTCLNTVAVQAPGTDLRQLPALEQKGLPVGLIANGDGDLKGRVLRINHYGRNAMLQSVQAAVTALAMLTEGTVAADSHEAQKDITAVKLPGGADDRNGIPAEELASRARNAAAEAWQKAWREDK